jgi:alkylation response protein AidB-like acyl-CoA dehydrogenase
MSFDHLAAARAVAAVAREQAVRTDAEARFPVEAVESAREQGLLSLCSAAELGGHGRGIRQAAEVVEILARECGSTAMVMTMHYSGAAVLERYGSPELRRELAAGRHLSTLAFSEAGSRSHFWAPLGSARAVGGEIELEAKKSWVTSANHADAYVWSSRPVAGEGPSSLWLVPRGTLRISVSGGFDGLGLRGNDSSPVEARAARIPAANRLGGDGEGFDIMMQSVLPIFSVLISAGSVGMTEAAVESSVQHASATRYAHLGESSLAQLPTLRAYLARMRIQTDLARSLWLDTLAALEASRPDAMLRVLEVKAATAEAASEVLDTAMRVCGGLAFRKDVGVERRFRDTRASLVMAPTSDQLFDFIGRAICGLPLFDGGAG